MNARLDSVKTCRKSKMQRGRVECSKCKWKGGGYKMKSGVKGREPRNTRS